MSVSKWVFITSACSSSETQMQYSDVSCLRFHFTTAILLIGSQVRWHKRDSPSLPYYCVIFGEHYVWWRSEKFRCLWEDGQLSCPLPMCKSLYPVHWDIFSQVFRVSDCSDGRACEAILTSGVAKKLFELRFAPLGWVWGMLGPQKILKI